MYENYHVLFVDDEENILASIRRGLMDEDYTCHFAGNGPMALTLMEQFNMAVIVSDMKMPGMDGLKLLKEVRQRWPKCIRIVLSGYTQLPQIILSINQADIFRFIPKPWKFEEDLIDSIRKALDYYILNEENEKYKQMLETKNALYTKMLHRLENQTRHYKQSVEFLTSLSKASITFGDELNTPEKEGAQEILNTRTEILDLFSNAAITGKQQFQSAVMANLVSDFIKTQFGITYVKYIDGKEIELNAFYEMLKAAIVAVKLILKDEFGRYGISARAGVNEEGVFGVYLLTMYDESDLESKALFDQKMAYLAKILGNLSAFGLTYSTHARESKVLLKIILN